jgi:hydroxypyruvate isomerase
MPRFSANLSFLFTDRPLLDRFAAAANAGFKGVEYMSPYQQDPRDIARRLADHGLTQALFNLPAGDWAAGERGLAILPGRDGEFRDGVSRALDCERLNCLAGITPPGVDRRILESQFLENLRYAADLSEARNIKLLIEPINDRDMPGFFLNRTDEALRLIGRVNSDKSSGRHLPHADHGGRPRAPARGGGAANRAHPDRRQPRTSRARHRRDQFPLPVFADRPPWIQGLGRMRIPTYVHG